MDMWTSQGNRTIGYIEIYRKRFIMKCGAHMIMEPEKSHHLPPAIWRPRKSGGVVLVQIQRPE